MRISDWSSDVCSSDLKDSVKGTATAASIWVTGAIGMAVGLGSLDVVVMLSVATVVTLWIMSTLKRADRKSVVYGQSVSVRVDLGGRRIINKNIKSYLCDLLSIYMSTYIDTIVN